MPSYALHGKSVHAPPHGQYWVAPNATLLGNVRLGRDDSISFGAFIRGDNERIDIGEGTNIQDGAVLHCDPGFPLTIGPRSLICHQAMVHGFTIGSNTLIGIGAIVPLATDSVEAGPRHKRKKQVKKYKKYSKKWWRQYRARIGRRKAQRARARGLRLRRLRWAQSAQASAPQEAAL